MEELQSVLHEKFGFEQFRSGQREVIEHVLAGRHTLAVLPTGLGKSLCYQLPAQMLSGITLVISPLIALMRDQVDKMRQRGFQNVTFLNSSLDQSAIAARYTDIERGKYKLVYVAPERCDSPRFQRLVTQSQIGLVVIDEAHCISQWGHDFRPHYRTLLKRLPELERATLLAMTATATAEVRKDIAAALGRPMEQVVADFNRPNLFFEVRAVEDRTLKSENLLRMLSSDEDPAIVYCSTRKEAEATRDILKSRGTSVCMYHAGMPLRDRDEAQRLFQSGQRRVMVATVAFGMGIDKPDVRRVIHFNIPGSIESYYQEAGRAGRDGLPATCSLLFSNQDLRVQRFLLDSSYPDHHLVYGVYDALLGAHPLSVSPTDLAKATDLPELTVKSALQLMYEQQHVGLARDGKYMVARPEVKRPAINFGPLVARGRRAERRLETIISYATGRGCRRAAILRYFGQRCEPPCEGCDSCEAAAHPVPKTGPQASSKPGTAESDRVARGILHGATEFSERLGRTTVAEVLSGSRRKKLVEWGLDRSKSYSTLGAFGRDYILEWIDELIKRRLLALTLGNYPLLLVTEAGKRALESKDLIALSGFDRSSRAVATSHTAPDPKDRAYSSRAVSIESGSAPQRAAGEQARPRVDDSLLRVKIEAWRQGGSAPSGEDLVDALDNPDIERGDLVVFINALGEMTYQPAATECRQMFLDAIGGNADANLLNALCNCVGRLGLVDLAPKLIELLDDPRAMARTSAARALGRLRIKDALERLQELATEDKSVSTRLAAHAASYLISGENIDD
jgi:ATP-dependent DNA helicase RecQ